MSPAALGQTVVTDTGAGGYRLAAASPSVPPEDREHLAVAPLVSDFLHLESPPRVYWSFHRLPSGARAFSRRHAAGTRRGSFNRIVVHSLVVPEEVLDALAWEPRLLPNCTYRPVGGRAEWAYKEVGAWDDAQVGARPDLEIATPPDAAARRLTLIAGRRQTLVERLGARRLEDELAQALSAIEQDLGFIAPQGDEPERLLALAWSLLPRANRREVGWTTHLPPGSGFLFRFANAPLPAEARAAERDPQRWAVEDGGLTKKVGGEGIARALVSGHPDWRAIAHSWYEEEKIPPLDLTQGGARIDRWILHVVEDGAPVGGFSNLDELDRFLARRKMTAASAADPWQSPASLLELAASTLVRHASNRPDPLAVAKANRILSGRQLESILTPGAVGEVASRDRKGDQLLAALDLAVPTNSRTGDDLSRLLAAAARPVAQRRDHALLGRIAERHLLPRLQENAGLGNRFSVQEIDLFLPALRPEILAEALECFPDSLYDRAVQELARRAGSDISSARKVASTLANLGKFPHAVRDRPSILGVAGALADAGAPADHWLAFALREASLLDSAGEEMERWRFVALLERAKNVGELAGSFAIDLRQAIDQSKPPGEALRAVTRRLASGLTVQAHETVATFARLHRLADEDLYAWGDTVAAVAAALEKAGYLQDASAMRRNWWTDLARRPFSPPSTGALGMLSGLRGTDASSVAQVWLPRLPDLDKDLAGQALAREIRTLAEGDPDRRRDLRLAELKAQFQAGLLSLEEVVLAVADLAGQTTIPAEFLLQVLVRDFLPKNPTERLLSLLPLATSPSLCPATRQVFDGKLIGALKEADLPRAASAAQLPLLDRRGDLLLAVARSWGESWQKVPREAVSFLKAILEHRHFDAAGVFLRIAERRKGFITKYLSNQHPELIHELARAAADPLHQPSLRAVLSQVQTSNAKIRERGAR